MFNSMIFGTTNFWIRTKGFSVLRHTSEPLYYYLGKSNLTLAKKLFISGVIQISILT